MGKAEETKKKILNTATEIVAQKGYAVSTTKEIATKAGVAEGTIFKYFKNKETLLGQILAKVFNGLKSESIKTIRTDLMNTEGTTIERLRWIFEERQVFFRRHHRVIKILVQEMPVNPMVRELVNKDIMPEILKIIGTLLDEGKEKGEIIGLPTKVLQMAFINTVLAPIFSGIIYEEELSGQLMQNHKDIFDIFIRGIEIRSEEI